MFVNRPSKFAYMKLVYTIIFLLLSSLSFSQSNEFAPIGTKWWYQYSNFSLSGYKILESVGDTVISGHNCRKLSSTIYVKDLSNPDSDLDTISQEAVYIYSDSGLVYIFALDSFYILYNYDGLEGTVWEVPGESADIVCDTTGLIKIDSLSLININGYNLKELYTSSLPGNYWDFGSSEIIERIGSTNYLLPTPTECLFDYYEGGPLRCYFDPELGYYNLDTSATCDYILDIIYPGDQVESGFGIWPNPVLSTFTISIPYNESNVKLNIYDLSGCLIFERQFNESETIDNISFPSGIYMFKISAQFFHETYKIIKL